jgi:lambda family phage minor tail protein L
MTTNVDIKQDIQNINVGSPIVSLFKLDTTVLGGGVYYFVSATESNTYVTFNSIQYSPLPVEFEGMSMTSDGKMARPTISISNISYLLLSEIITYKDLIGSKLTRTRTFMKYLDGQSEADVNAKFPDDIFYLEQKIQHNKYLIKWSLRCALDLDHIMIPKRQCLSYCNYKYLGVSDANSECPYDGSNGFFTELGVSTTEENDKCGKKLTDCKLRFGNNPLPIRGFPSIGNFGKPYR